MAEEQKYADEAGASPTDSLVGDPPQKKPGMWAWFKQKPLARWPFCFFACFGALGFVWMAMYFMSEMTAFVLAAACSLILSSFGAYHFKILLGLKEQVDKMSRLNNEFKAENVALKTQVSKLSKAREELSQVEVRLQAANEKLKDNLEKFRALEENLQGLADSNIEGLAHLQEASAEMMSKWNDSLIKHEKAILEKVYDQYGMLGGDADMDKAEFEGFMQALPETYQRRFTNIGRTFEEFAGDDGKIDFDEFTKVMDTFAEEEAARGGST